MDILYVDLEKHDVSEIVLMARQLESLYTEDNQLLVVHQSHA